MPLKSNRDDKQLQQLLSEGLDILNLPISLAPRLIQYLQLLLKWNRAYNLIGTNDPEIILQEHILDSLTLAPYIKGQRIIDVGSGAGLPGIPLALLFPEKQFVLLDSVGKKTRFLTQALAELQIKNVTIVQERVEKYFPSQCFNHIVVRAFGTINDIIVKTEQLCCLTGSWLLMKGICPKKELLGLSKKVTIYSLKVPKLNKIRHLIFIENTQDENNSDS